MRLAASGSRRCKEIMSTIKMNANAALYLGSDWHAAQNEGARHFPTAAQAVRFAMEEAAPVSLKGALLVVDGRSIAGDGIASLYRSPAYPFRHKVTRRYRPSATARRLEHSPRSMDG